MEDLTGKQLGPYQIIGPLGEGGMAAVYKAFQPSMERVIALKVLPRHYANDPEFTGRFHREARVIANLQHPHILPVFDFGQSDGYTYLAMPFVEGGTLSDRLRHSRLELPEIQRILNQVGDALDYAHAQGIIHRDIKPSNILLDRRNNCLLADFGLARLIENTGFVTQSGGILGTPAYMSPEQGLGEKVDSRSDIYSLGVILYQMVAGRPPFQAETPMAIMVKHIHDPLLPPRHHNPAVPEAVERVILKALAKNPADRYPTAGDMVRALNQAIATSAPTTYRPATASTIATPIAPRAAPTTNLDPTELAPPPSAPRQPSQPARRLSRWLAAAALAGLFGLFLLIAAALLLRAWFTNRAEQVTDNNDNSQAAAPPTIDSPPVSSDGSDAWNELLTQANDAFENGDWEQAEELYDQAIDLEPERPEAYCYRGNVLFEDTQYEDAADNFEQCAQVATASNQPEFVLDGQFKQLRAQGFHAWLEEGDYETAAGYLTAMIELDPTIAYPYCDLGDLYNWDMEQWQDAFAPYQTCIELAPDADTERWGGYGLAVAQAALARDSGDWQAAVAAYDQAISYEPEAAWLYCERASLHLLMEDREAARQSAQTCLDLSSDDPDVHTWAEELLAELTE